MFRDFPHAMWEIYLEEKRDSFEINLGQFRTDTGLSISMERRIYKRLNR